jgi:putative transposase
VGYKSSKNVVYSCKYHVVWCPKYRRPVLVNGVAKRLKHIILDTAKDRGSEVMEREVMPGDVHLLREVDPPYGVHRMIREIKGRSSHIRRREFPSLATRLPTLWTHSYFVSTVGGSPLGVLKQYIENQKRSEC